MVQAGMSNGTITNAPTPVSMQTAPSPSPSQGGGMGMAGVGQGMQRYVGVFNEGRNGANRGIRPNGMMQGYDQAGPSQIKVSTGCSIYEWSVKGKGRADGFM
jgi:hypothetical protein